VTAAPVRDCLVTTLAARAAVIVGLVVALAGSVSACEDERPGSGGAGSTRSTTTSSSASSTSALSSTVATSSTATGAAACGGPGAIKCADGFFCDWTTDLCNSDDGFGECTPRPDVCDGTGELVCACNGVTYANSCEAAKAGWDRSNLGACPAPDGKFGCGWRFCVEGEYCEHRVRDTAGGADDFACRAVPSSCGAAPDCSCLASVECGQNCTTDFTLHLVVTCGQ